MVFDDETQRMTLAERVSLASPSPTQVVIKIPADHVLSGPVWSKKFARQARVLANISHTKVVKTIAFWPQIGNTHEQALVQELVSGASGLSEFIQSNPQNAASLLLQTLYALRAFHGETSPSAIHRDYGGQRLCRS